jgi:hypothetical protein
MRNLGESATANQKFVVKEELQWTVQIDAEPKPMNVTVSCSWHRAEPKMIANQTDRYVAIMKKEAAQKWLKASANPSRHNHGRASATAGSSTAPTIVTI